MDADEINGSTFIGSSELASAKDDLISLELTDNYEIEIDAPTFEMLLAIANAEDDPQSLIALVDIDPNDFREFLRRFGESENEDALELLRVAEENHLAKNSVRASQKRSYATGRKLYVGNLAFQTTSEDLQELFASAGTVESAAVVEDRDTGRSRGFAFVEMSSDEEATSAIEQFNGKEVRGRALKVNEAQPRENRSHRGREQRR
jgi:RNA recognition motif-containing protein